MPKHARNVLIVLLLALAVYGVPGGDEATSTLSNLLSITFFGAFLFFLGRMYVERRDSIEYLEDRTRIILFAGVGALLVAIAGTGRLWESGIGALVWFVVIGLSVYGLVFAYREHRAY